MIIFEYINNILIKYKVYDNVFDNISLYFGIVTGPSLRGKKNLKILNIQKYGLCIFNFKHF